MPGRTTYISRREGRGSYVESRANSEQVSHTYMDTQKHTAGYSCANTHRLTHEDTHAHTHTHAHTYTHMDTLEHTQNTHTFS